MKYTNLGNTGLKVSRICLGMMTYGTSRWRPWILDEDAARPIVHRAVELGVNFFDTADMYSAGISEEVTGKLLREVLPREDMVIATKVYFPVDINNPGGGVSPSHSSNRTGLSRKHIFDAVDASLRRLGTDHIDLYQIHRWDPTTPIAETMSALHDIVKAGKVRYIGASSMWAWQFAKAQHIADSNGWTRFVSMQNHYNLIYREEEREMIPQCIDQGVALIPWSPLARGFLAGNRTQKDSEAGATTRATTDDYAQKLYYRDDDFAVVARLSELAQQRGESNATLAYSWLLHRGVTAPIVGASKVAQIEAAVAAVDVKLSSEELVLLEEPYKPHPVLGHS
ncbi:MAG: putative oxidoreductase [Verrucomicrobiaceae bacterium]|nr:putative oxidoreductase [Verrucomicrobiaceae bacterium]